MAPTDLDAHGYVEQEWLISGVVDAIDPDGVCLAGRRPYTTRLLVRRPADPDRFSGTAFVDPLHMIGEAPASWRAGGWMMARGHAWIGVTVHNSSFGRGYGYRGGIDALKQAAPARYGSLELAELAHPPRMRSYQGPSAESFALRWNMAMAHPQGHAIAAHVAAAAKRDERLCGRPVDVAHACGFSQTANFWRLFLDQGGHERFRLDGGRPAFDAYVLLVSPGPSHHPVDATVVNVLSESEVVGTIVQMQATAAPDRCAPRVRGYELPGAPHLLGEPQDVLRDGGAPAAAHVHTEAPYVRLLPAMLDNLDTWVRGGPPMPHVPRIQRDPESVDGVVRDEHGNAVGGIRVPWLEAPTSQYLPRCDCSPTIGETIPFTAAVLTSLYRNDADHEARWDRAVTRLVEDRLLLADDAEAYRAHRAHQRPAQHP